MADAKTSALADVQRLAERAERAKAEHTEIRRQRDEALRMARDAGATYAEMQAASGLSNVSVTKALRRE